jgi:hypothetical protein
MLLIFIRTTVQGHLYGSQVFDASTTTGNLQRLLQQQFQAPLMPQYTELNNCHPFILTILMTGTSEAFENST